MKIWENGEIRDMTPEEIKEMESQARLMAITEKTRPLTIDEVNKMLMAAQINTLSVDDNTALRMKEFYPSWVVNTPYDVDFKVQYNNKLYKVLQAHTSQAGWEPTAVASLWTEINETHTGELDDPIPYSGNMALENGKYYI